MDNSHRLPRRAVVWGKIVTSASSSSAGKSVSSRHGRILAVMPMSTSQISPLRASPTNAVLCFQLIEHHKPLAGGFVAKRNAFTLHFHFNDFPAQFAPLVVGEFWQFLDDLGHAHALQVTGAASFLQYLRGQVVGRLFLLGFLKTWLPFPGK